MDSVRNNLNTKMYIASQSLTKQSFYLITDIYK